LAWFESTLKVFDVKKNIKLIFLLLLLDYFDIFILKIKIKI